ncbi:hypothetical protein [Herpetosiphon gulosus]|uniref:Uncharacterized protein n=1 Tax=Herpetosiphon gulosus TaxID=1973496 RepID=A0ABP9WTW0_9CHLR
MLTTLFFVALLLVALAALPYISRSTPVVEDDSDEPQLRMKPTRQR